MSEWKTRITKVQVVKPRVDAGEACLVLIYPAGPDMGKRFPLSRNEVATPSRVATRACSASASSG